jgi:hypothetical protein
LISRDEAAARVLALAGGAQAGARLLACDLVARLDGGDYWLATAALEAGGGLVAAIEAADGAAAASARFADEGARFWAGREAALAAAGLGPGAAARLVWGPSRASQSMLYPLWEVSAGARRVWVDAGGRAWTKLPAGRGG